MGTDKKSNPKNNFTAGDSFFGQMREAGIADDNFVREIVSMFLKEGDENLDRLKNAIVKSDISETKLYAHKLKSSFLMFDMHEAHQTVTNMEASNEMNTPQLLKDVEVLRGNCAKNFVLLKDKYLK